MRKIILLIENDWNVDFPGMDNQALVREIQKALELSGDQVEVEIIESADEAMAQIKQGGIDTLFLLSGNSSLSAEEVAEKNPGLRVAFFVKLPPLEEESFPRNGLRFLAEKIRAS